MADKLQCNFSNICEVLNSYLVSVVDYMYPFFRGDLHARRHFPSREIGVKCALILLKNKIKRPLRPIRINLKKY